jgi:predicted negative regulator of RcsB-dependent stress response
MAIDDLLDEHEQGERVRSWLRKNGAVMVGGVALGVAVIVGWQWWNARQGTARIAANMRYAAFVTDLQAGKFDKAKAEVAGLKDSVVYDELAALRLAKAQSEAGKGDDAIATLRGVPTDSRLRQLVDIRLAKLLIEAGKATEALALVDKADDSSALEVKGDALAALGRKDQARAAYDKALVSLDVAAPQRRLVELKLTDVGGTVAKPAEPI